MYIITAEVRFNAKWVNPNSVGEGSWGDNPEHWLAGSNHVICLLLCPTCQYSRGDLDLLELFVDDSNGNVNLCQVNLSVSLLSPGLPQPKHKEPAFLSHSINLHCDRPLVHLWYCIDTFHYIRVAFCSRSAATWHFSVEIVVCFQVESLETTLLWYQTGVFGDIHWPVIFNIHWSFSISSPAWAL